MVGLTEIKLKVDHSFLPIIEMPGYSFTFQPSLLNAGELELTTFASILWNTSP